MQEPRYEQESVNDKVAGNYPDIPVIIVVDR